MNFVALRSFGNYMEANIVMHMLQHHNISCHLKDEHIVTIDPLFTPAIGGIKLMVHPTHVERAWDLIDKAEERYLRSIPCPVCKRHALTAVSVTKSHRCKLAALAAMLLKGESLEVSRMYQCTACGYDFKELPSEA